MGILLTPPSVRLSTRPPVHPSAGRYVYLCVFKLWPLLSVRQGCARATLLFRASVVCLSLSCYLLLNHRADFNQTCYITSPHSWGVRVCESSIILQCVRQAVRLTSVHLSVSLSPPKSLGGIQPNLLHRFPSW